MCVCVCATHKLMCMRARLQRDIFIMMTKFTYLYFHTRFMTLETPQVNAMDFTNWRRRMNGETHCAWRGDWLFSFEGIHSNSIRKLSMYRLASMPPYHSGPLLLGLLHSAHTTHDNHNNSHSPTIRRRWRIVQHPLRWLSVKLNAFANKYESRVNHTTDDDDTHLNQPKLY